MTTIFFHIRPIGITSMANILLLASFLYLKKLRKNLIFLILVLQLVAAQVSLGY